MPMDMTLWKPQRQLYLKVLEKIITCIILMRAQGEEAYCEENIIVNRRLYRGLRDHGAISGIGNGRI